jgi:hypothetical protein
MSEQTPAPGAPGEDKPAVGGPEGAATEAVDWRQRFEQVNENYSNLQPEYTRATQEREQYREALEWYELMLTHDDPEVRAQAAEALGYQFGDEEQQQRQGQEDPEDPFEPIDNRLRTLEEREAQRESLQVENEQAQAVREVLDTRLEELMPGSTHPDPDLAKAIKYDQDAVLAYAINALPPTQDGMPDLDTAFQLYSERNDARLADWARSKRAPSFHPSGQSTTEVPNLDNDQERQDYMVRRLMANQET